jgi:hypothetical protein
LNCFVSRDVTDPICVEDWARLWQEPLGLVLRLVGMLSGIMIFISVLVVWRQHRRFLSFFEGYVRVQVNKLHRALREEMGGVAGSLEERIQNSHQRSVV